jgi:hypothetical protein
MAGATRCAAKVWLVFARRGASDGILGWAQRGDREGVQVGAQKIAQGIIHQALPLDPAATGERFGDDQKAKMAFTLRASARMAGMARGFVDQLDPLRLELGQTRAHLVRDPHG